MGGATDLCTDKTGTLTENRMTVVRAWLGGANTVFTPSAVGMLQLAAQLAAITDGGGATGSETASASSAVLGALDSVDAVAARQPTPLQHVAITATLSTAPISARSDGHLSARRGPNLFSLTAPSSRNSSNDRESRTDAVPPGVRSVTSRTHSYAHSTKQYIVSTALPIQSHISIVCVRNAPATLQRHSNWLAVPMPLRELLRDQLCLNSTAIALPAVSSASGSRRRVEVKGSKTEGAGIALVESFGIDPMAVRSDANNAVLQRYSFSSERKMMSTLVALGPLGAAGPVRLYVTGGSDFILARCTSVLMVIIDASVSAFAQCTLLHSIITTPGLDRTTQVNASNDAASCTPLTSSLADGIVSGVIIDMARQSLRTLGLAYRYASSLWPAHAKQPVASVTCQLCRAYECTLSFDPGACRDFQSADALPAGCIDNSTLPPEEDLTLYAVLGIKDPLRRHVTEAVAACKMVRPTGRYGRPEYILCAALDVLR